MDKDTEWPLDMALERLQDAARLGDSLAKEWVAVRTSDLIEALRILDQHKIINLDLD